MSGNGKERERWAEIPDHPGYVASTDGKVAKLAANGRGFRVLARRPDTFGLMTVRIIKDGRVNSALVGALVLTAHGHPHPNGYRIAHRDGDLSNCSLENVIWERKGKGRLEDRKKRRCLGVDCGATFMSFGSGNRLCGRCNARIDREGCGMDGVQVPGEIPDAPSLAPPATRRG